MYDQFYFYESLPKQMYSVQKILSVNFGPSLDNDEVLYIAAVQQYDFSLHSWWTIIYVWSKEDTQVTGQNTKYVGRGNECKLHTYCLVLNFDLQGVLHVEINHDDKILYYFGSHKHSH